jgi:hypothetical protein
MTTLYRTINFFIIGKTGSFQEDRPMRVLSRSKHFLLASFITLFFLTSLIFSVGYVSHEEIDCSDNLTYENQDLPTLSALEKIKIFFFMPGPGLFPPSLNHLELSRSFIIPYPPADNKSGCLRC